MTSIKPSWYTIWKALTHEYVINDNYLSVNTRLFPRKYNTFVFKQITDINLKRGILNYIFNTATIELVVRSGGYNQLERIILYDIKNYEEIKNKLIKLSSNKSYIDTM